MADDKTLIPVQVALTGRLITGDDAAIIGAPSTANFQSLKNMRYTDVTPKSISGMSKINTTALSTHPKIRSGFHFKKDQPAESHILVRAYNSGETESKVFKNDTAIPNQGDFSATALHTDNSGSGKGFFSKAISGNVAYCNSKESLIWGGAEHFSSGFVNYDPDQSWTNDYTSEVQNILTDVNNVAVLTKVTTSVPTNGLLLHLDNNVTDSGGTGHTVTNTNVTFTTTSKFGTHAAVLNGSTAYLTVPDHADFDFSGGNFSIDFLMKRDAAPDVEDYIFAQATDANNYMSLSLSIFGIMTFEIYSAGVAVVSLIALPGSFLPNLINGEFHHIEISENSNDWYMFIDGNIAAYSSDTDRAANYTGLFYIGAANLGAGIVGNSHLDATIDEFHINKATGHTAYFEPYQVPYGTDAAYVKIGAVRPLQGAKFYIGTANTTASSVNVQEWNIFEAAASGTFFASSSNQGMWVDTTTQSDGTASGGNSLAVDGSITFDSTTSNARPQLYNGRYLYWYNFIFSEVDDTTSITQVTLDMPFQQVQDLWDGELRSALYASVVDGATKNDVTVNVFEPTYDSANEATFADASSLSAGVLLVGFAERMTALDIRMVSGKENTTVSIPLVPLHWNGKSYTVNIINKDGTSDNNKVLNRSGRLIWNSPTAQNESRQEIEGRIALYYYRINVGVTSANTHIYYIGGIPTQRQIDSYKFPISSHNKLMLCSNQDDKKNSILVGANGTNSVFNGSDSIEILLGDDEEFVAGIGLYSLFSSSLYNLTILCKLNETWILEGDKPANYRWFRGSESIGCVAPYTMKSINIEPTKTHPGFNDIAGQDIRTARKGYNGAIWQGVNGIYIFNGQDFTPIHLDIDDVFERLNPDKIADSVGFVDEKNDEYHWLVATGASTTLNEEWVFDVRRSKWYQAERGVNLQTGFWTTDTLGNKYTYGAIDTGYLERLENGTTFDGSDIISEIHTGDVTLDGNIMTETQIRKIKLITVAKSNTVNNITVTHYGDTETTGTSFQDISPLATGKRLVKGTKSVNHQGAHIFHSLKFILTTDDETSGFEPLYLGGYYKRVRESLGG